MSEEELRERIAVLELALRNCRALADQQLKRNTKNPGTEHIARNILRFCESAGITGSVLRRTIPGHGSTGLDDGPYLPGKAPRKKPEKKTPEELRAIRLKAWETRRSR